MPNSRLALFPLSLVFYEISIYLSNDMYLPALPQMMAELGLDSVHAQFTLTTWFLGQTSLPLLAGVISDRYGRRPILLLGGIVYIIATILCALSNNVTSLLIGRFLEGCMVATMLVPGYACIHELYEKNAAIKILALMGSITVLAPALGPLFGGFILVFSGWRSIFWVIALWAALGVFLLWKFMPEPNAAENREPIHLAKLLAQYGRILINRNFISLMVVLGFIFTGWIAWISAGSLLIIENFHYSAIIFGVIQALIFAVYILGSYLVKHLIDRLGAHRLIELGLIITLSGGILMVLTALTFPTSLFPFLAALSLYSLGSAFCISPLNRIVIESSEEPMGVRVAMFTVILSSFAALGSGLAGLFFNGSLASLAYLIAGAIIFACLLKLFTKAS